MHIIPTHQHSHFIMVPQPGAEETQSNPGSSVRHDLSVLELQSHTPRSVSQLYHTPPGNSDSLFSSVTGGNDSSHFKGLRVRIKRGKMPGTQPDPNRPLPQASPFKVQSKTHPSTEASLTSTWSSCSTRHLDHTIYYLIIQS